MYVHVSCHLEEWFSVVNPFMVLGWEIKIHTLSVDSWAKYISFNVEK